MSSGFGRVLPVGPEPVNVRTAPGSGPPARRLVDLGSERVPTLNLDKCSGPDALNFA